MVSTRQRESLPTHDDSERMLLTLLRTFYPHGRKGEVREPVRLTRIIAN